MVVTNVPEVHTTEPHMYARPLPIEMLTNWKLIKKHQLESGTLLYVFSKDKSE